MRRPQSTVLAHALMVVVGLAVGRTVVVGAFSSAYLPLRHQSRLGSLPSWFSGVSGIAPSSLLAPEWTDGLFKDTSLSGVELECVYKASVDGWSSVDFHRNCDSRGSGMVLALSRSGSILGGFNPLGWRSTDDYSNSNSAFLWFLRGNQVQRCSVLPGGNAAVFDYAAGGPCFGSADLVIGSPQAAVMGGFAGPDMMDTSAIAGSLKKARSTIGGAYNFDKNWPVSGDFGIVEIEVYCNAAIKPLSDTKGWWPFG